MSRIMNDDICRESAKKFNGRTEFHHGDNVAWKYAKRTGLMNELFPNKIVKQSAVTFNTCQVAVENLKRNGKIKPIDFWRFSRNMFEIARDNGWLPSFYPSYKVRRHLSKKDISELAASCSTRTEFARFDSAAYKKACDMHLIDKLFPETVHHEPWTKEACKIAALSCKNRKEFKRKYEGAYKVALHKGWMDELIPRVHKEITETRCREVAKQCHSRSEFREKGDHLYNYALSHHLIDTFASDYSWLPTSLVESNAQRKYSDTDVEQAARKYTKLSTFRQKDKRMYDIAYERKLLSSFTWLERNEEVIKNGFHDAVYVYEFIDTKTVNSK